MNFQVLRENLNNAFNEIITLISELVAINNNQFKTIIELNKKIDFNLRDFVTNLLNEIENIYISLTTKLSDINIEQLKQEIEDATTTFLDITVDLELLSYNTICKTLNLDKKGATIAYISHEIKKHSDNAKSLMKGLTANFNKIYDNYQQTIGYLKSLKENMDFQEKSDISDIVKELTLSSDISKLIEYLQFHDIYNQQIEKIENSLSNIKELEELPENLGKKLKIYESTIDILKEMQNDLEEALINISEIIKDYIYKLNSDVQDIISKTEIVKSVFQASFKKGEALLLSIEKLSDFIHNIFQLIEISTIDLKTLEKFSKSFYVLIVLSSIEISRIGEKSMLSLTDFMNKTHSQLLDLMDKLIKTIDVWKGLANELNHILIISKKNYEKFKSIDIKKEIENISKTNETIENNLNKIKQMLAEKDYNELILEYKNTIFEIINRMIQGLEDEYKKLDLTIPDEIKKSQEFIKGYTETDIDKIKADEEDLSNIELF